ncbi:MAG: trypsin-like peptidase domain-containing protein [Dehalococcoidia bacterium]|jgi:2-alkenal reductase|nr:trypsin-like peptidase domain-containing protein [Dehalococcoidia bacterium]MDP7082769.1 trypsin-like peptidase domain-containing protein [Dehalococcoidia bacterium]MDP7200237.1 trypsin-like peptidase domain-containing protein [Dehalococcoidia bacterium]MDP7511695.1 trypsin-like peptidase domain-containing protein [Dehalococcoidia bacterium]HJN86547.1 trypsin-like peptidase domain-containing protein [Dehalococcoidia bacterium]
MGKRKFTGSAPIRHWPVVVAVVVLSLILASCGGSGTATPVADAVLADISSTSSPDTLGPLSIESLDADAIVAAQEEVMVRIYENVLPSIVRITVRQRVDGSPDSRGLPDVPGFRFPDLPEDFFERGEGSGFVWDEEGHIVTNNHVIQDADRVTVIFADRTEIEARVLGTDPDSDLAVLELDESKDDARPVTLGDSDALRVGQMAVAIGNPFGQEFTMTSGIISALGRTIRSGSSSFTTPEVVQTDAPINPGNSGGPLLDRKGRVIAVTTQIISRSGVSAGIGLSVPINAAKQVIPALIEDGSYEYSWLGITGITLRPEVAERMDLPRETGGVLVIQVADDSPAERAGLNGSDSTVSIEGVPYPVGGDIIVAIEGTALPLMSDLIAFLTGNTRPGDKVVLDIIRDGDQREQLDVTLGKRPDSG